jgi:hypothetical protein
MVDNPSPTPLKKGILARIVKLLFRIFFGSFLLILLLLVVVHIPVVQKKITIEISEYLSNKTGGDISINEINFSIMGNIEVNGLEVNDPSGKNVLSADRIALEFSTADLTSGDLIFYKTEISGFDSQLIETNKGINIKFFIDAFQVDEKDHELISDVPKETSLQFNEVTLQDVHFRYLSLINNVDFQTNLGSLKIEEAYLDINPNRIEINHLLLENTHSSLITSRNDTQSPKVSPGKGSNQLPGLDFNSGFEMEIQDFKIMDNSFSFHQNESLEKEQFNPDHIDASNIEIQLAGVLIRSDSLSAQIRQIAANLDGFSLQEFEAGINIGQNKMDLSDLNLVTKRSKLTLDLGGTFNHFPNLINELDQAAFQLSLAGHIDKIDLHYFLGDSIVEYIRNWPVMQLDADARYESGQVEIKELNFGVGNSELYVKGIITNLLSGENIGWKNLNVNTSIGNEFKKSLSPFTTDFILPPNIRLLFITSGNPQDFDLDGQLMTSWGNIRSKGSAGLYQTDMAINITIVGDRVRLGELLGLSWMGSTDFSMKTTAKIGDDQEIDIQGSLNRIDLFDQSILNTNIRSLILNKTTSTNIIIEDPNYRSKIDTDISFVGPLNISGSFVLDKFSIGKLISQDTSLRITGDLKTKILMDQPSIQGFLNGHNITIETETLNHGLDSMNLDFGSTPKASSIEFFTDNINGTSKANFDIREAPELFEVLLQDYIMPSDSLWGPEGNRNLKFDVTLGDATLLQLLHLDIKDFRQLTVTGEFDEINQALEIEALTRGFNGYGLSFDSLDLSLKAISDSLNSQTFIKNLYYDSTHLGDMKLDIVNSGNTSFSDLHFIRDSIYLLAVNSRLAKFEQAYYLSLDSLVVLQYTYNVDSNNPIIINKDDIIFNQFKIDREEMEISLNGSINQFDLNVRNIDLGRFNEITTDTVINSGILSSTFSYSKPDQRINLNLNIDSLTFYEYPPMYIIGKAENEGSNIPFQFELNSTTNNIELGGDYNFDNSKIDGKLVLDINDLEVFEVLSPGYLDEMGGKIIGETVIGGTLNEPTLDGSLQLLDIRLVTANPKAIVEIQDEFINLDNSGITLNNFTLYDQVKNPLTINGFLKTRDYRSFEYDLDLKTDKYILINNTQVNESQIQGILVLGGDIKMSGTNSSTLISANLIIKDSTDLSYLTTSEDIELISGEGIVEFVDPGQSFDSTISINTQFYYDSLLASLPKFELNSRVKLEEYAMLRLILDPRSGDYIEATGTADIQIDLDRTGNARVTGNYTITDGDYQLSFYDIVKKAFKIAPGSNIVWEGDPNTGNLNVTALSTIKTSSTGLIGHEVSENEKAIYRRALPYEVSIIISGFIDSPQISFGLDLPQEEKNNYPALASKLSRLKQPEYESELNKQVFGLLVLGGFLPESSGSEFNQSLVATTAISNSVNSILASQLNRFAGKYVKGVDIDVGLQSYSDFTSGSGQTRTSMDFRVSKRMMDDRLSFEIGGGMDITTDQSGPNTGSDNFRGDVAIIYDLTESGNKQLKAFNNETYDIIYHQVRNTGVSLIFIKEFDRGEK